MGILSKIYSNISSHKIGIEIVGKYVEYFQQFAAIHIGVTLVGFACEILPFMKPTYFGVNHPSLTTSIITED